MFYSIPPVTRALIIANVVVFLLQQVAGELMVNFLALWPLGSSHVLPPGFVGFQPWQIITYAFLHANFMHILFNMFALYMFGSEVERLFGPRRYLNLYFISVVTAALTQLLFATAVGGEPYYTVGASGGVFGLLLAYGMYFPNRIVMLLFPPIPMPAKYFVTLFGVFELYLGVTGSGAGVAHFAHLGGMLGAWLLIRYWRGRPPFGPVRRR